MSRGNWKVKRGRNARNHLQNKKNQRTQRFTVRQKVQKNLSVTQAPRSTQRRIPQRLLQRSSKRFNGRRTSDTTNFRQKLDKELDSYWGNKGENLTKVNLDNELDNYWNNTTQEDVNQNQNAQPQKSS